MTDWTATVPIGLILFWYGIGGSVVGPVCALLRVTKYWHPNTLGGTSERWRQGLRSLVLGFLLWPGVLYSAVTDR